MSRGNQIVLEEVDKIYELAAEVAGRPEKNGNGKLAVFGPKVAMGFAAEIIRMGRVLDAIKHKSRSNANDETRATVELVQSLLLADARGMVDKLLKNADGTSILRGDDGIVVDVVTRCEQLLGMERHPCLDTLEALH